MLLFGLAVAISTQAPSEPDRALPSGARACFNWLSGRHDSGASGETRITGRGVLCFDGVIDEASARTFVKAARRLATNSHPIIVVRSVGGDVDAALTMADTVRPLRATLIASQVCLSSCANFLLPAGKKRIVRKDAILGFHGGALPTSTAQVEQDIRAEDKVATKAQAERVATHLNRTYDHEQAFLTAAHLDRNFFAWMARFNTLPVTAKQRICPGLSGAQPFFVFSSDLLAEHGYKLDLNDGPSSAAQLADVLKMYGIPVANACFVGTSNADW